MNPRKAMPSNGPTRGFLISAHIRRNAFPSMRARKRSLTNAILRHLQARRLLLTGPSGPFWDREISAAAYERSPHIRPTETPSLPEAQMPEFGLLTIARARGVLFGSTKKCWRLARWPFT